ncbi:MAG: hypothetical protein K2N52_00725, partial [Clostridia bacterium]|nr:hypothetical protein [Clostridia bacterium]
MKLKIRKRNLVTIILSVICAVLLGCSVAMLTGITSRNAFALKSSNDLDIGELTVANYDSSNGSAVFSGEKLSALYDALTGTTDNSATLNKVAATLVGTMTSTYGYGSATVNLPTYKTAADLYALNGGKNIVVSLAGQQFAVSFLTTDSRGHVIATLWMTQPLKDSSGTMVTGKFGWATAAYSINYTTTIGESYISNAYSSSMLRMKLLNAGATSGSATAYAMGSTNSNNVTTRGVTVSSAERLSNVLAPFTLDN